MKARPFLALVLTLAILALGLGLGGWWLVWRRGPLQLARQDLTMPRAARFVPRHAPLSLYLLTDAERPLAYARTVAPPRGRAEATERIIRLRDGAFAAAGLEYAGELAGWLGPEIGLAFLDDPPAEGQAAATREATGRWLLALSSRDGDGARRFLQRFWQTRSLAGTDLQVSQYRGMGLISGRGGRPGTRPAPLATALVEDDLVLIASGRGVLEEALDVSQIDDLNQAGQSSIRDPIERLGRGVGLMVIRPPALQEWFSVPTADGEPGQRSPQLLAAFRPEGRSLHVTGWIDGIGTAEEVPDHVDPPAWKDLAERLWTRPTSLALLQDPATLLQHPILVPLLRRITTPGPAAGPLPPLVAAADTGPLLLADGPDGWLMGTAPGTPEPGALEPALAAEGLIPAPLELERRPVQVWTRLEPADSGRERKSSSPPGDLQATLAGWQSLSDGEAWWGNGLQLLREEGSRRNGGRDRIAQLRGLNLPAAPLQWALGPQPAASLLQEWNPWHLLSVLSGGGLSEQVEGLSLALVPEEGSLRFEGLVDLG